MSFIKFLLLRADDHIVLEGRLLNMDVVDVDGVPHAHAGQNDGGVDGCAIELTPPPQYIVEYADKVSQPAPLQPKPIYASPSNLVFSVPAPAAGRTIPLTVAGLLEAITELEIHSQNGLSLDPVVDPLDVATNGTVVAERARRAAALVARAAPAVESTAVTSNISQGDPNVAVPGSVGVPSAVLIAPARLMWALPTGAARFTHQHEPSERAGRVEQWHTRLGVRTGSGKSAPLEVDVPLRSIFFNTLRPSGTSTAFKNLVDPVKINSPVDEFAAEQIAAQSMPAGGALDLDHLRVSTLGATLDLDGSWTSGAIRSYRHHIIDGRDEKVRVATRGRLFPFGHRAVLASTVQRELRGDVDGAVAALVRRSVLTVKDRIKDVGGSGKTGRQWPWRSVEILNRVSPPGDEIALGSGIVHLQVTGRPFASVCRATDHSGQVVTFSVPLLFVPDGVTDAAARGVWNARGSDFKRFRLDGQRVGLTAVAGAGERSSPDATTLVVRHAQVAMTTDAQGKVVPVVAEYLGSSPVIDGLGQQGATTIRYSQQFLDHGFGGLNSGELLVLLDGPLTTIGQGRALASATMQVRAVSRAVGAVASNAAPSALAADLAAVAGGAFDPRKWFSGLEDTTLFGVFPLGQLLPAPGTLTLVEDAPYQTAALLDGRKTFTSTWKTTLLQLGGAVPVGPAVLRTDGQAMLLTLENTTSVVPGTQEIRTRSTAEVEHAVIALAAGTGGPELIALAVPSLRFETVDAAAPTVDVSVGKLDFLGPLSWVATLAKLLENTGLGGLSQRTAAGRAEAAVAAAGNGTGVQVYDDRVEASLVLAVPGLALGAFSLTDLVFRSDFALYLEGQAPTLTLAFSRAENPFHLTIALFGGGGHLRVKVSTKELVEIIGALEFGAAVSVNLAGIVKGGASVMAGIGFELRPGKVDLSGYVDMRGHLDVLGLIALTIQVLVLVAYESASGKVEGKAQVSVKVKVLFFKKTVKFEVHHEFAGSGSDAARALGAGAAIVPDAAAWNAYWDTFAAA